MKNPLRWPNSWLLVIHCDLDVVGHVGEMKPWWVMLGAGMLM